MSQYEDDEKKSIGFMIFAILLSIILVVFTAFLMFQVFRLQVLPENIVPNSSCAFVVHNYFSLVDQLLVAWNILKNHLFTFSDCGECYVWIG